ncbi:MAG: PD40 domain-containing protein [Acidobacteriaceae bacterium]|nr:PD40 domain-containing protein [Acidobacteriaceae bacterium]
MTDLVRGIAPQLAWIVARCLRKDPERRFQSMTEIKAALQDLRSESSSNLSRSLLSPGIAPSATTRAKDTLRSWLVLGNLILFLLCVGAGLWILHGRHQPQPELPKLTRLTTEGGLNIDPAISPDGEFVAYASDRSGEGNLDIWVRQIGGSQAVRLTHDPADDDEPTFSPDGTQIAFHSERGGSGLYLAPTLGGSERRIADGGRDPQFSPDGTQIAYWKGPRNPYPIRSGSGDLFIVDLSNFTTQQVRPDLGASLYPVWSPDGKRILFVGIRTGDRDNTTYGWYTTPLDGGPAVPCGHMITEESAPRPHSWHQHFVLFTEDMASPAYIGEIALDPRTYQPSGPIRRLTTATAIEDSPSVARDGRIVFSNLSQATNLSRFPIDPRTVRAAAEPVPLTRDTGDDYPGSVSEDGRKLVFTTDRSGNEEVWTRDTVTDVEHQLTFGGARERIDPLISPDGTLVAWRENYLANPTIFITPFVGGTSREACAECQQPEVWTPDSRVLLYRTPSLPKTSIGALTIQSWTHTIFMRDPILDLRADSLSTDGKWLLFTAFKARSDYKIYAAPFSLSRPPARSSWMEVLHSPDSDPQPVWSKDGTVLFFSSSRDGFNCIWGLRLNKDTKQPVGQPFAVRHFHTPSAVLEAPNFYNPLVLGSDGIVVGLIERSGSIWMMNGNS